MAWVRLDDKFPEHPKIAAITPAAAWLHVCAIAYCNRHETDGFVPESVVNVLSTSRKRAPLVDSLVKVELWHSATRNGTAGYLIHDYLEYQPSRSQRMTERASARERMANNRRTAPEVRPNMSGSSEDVREKFALPRPDPTRITTSVTDTDDIQPVTESSSTPVDIALRIAARATYLVNPHACNAQNPKRYIEGIERTMRLERSIEASELAATGMHPANIAAALTKAPTPAIEEAAINLGIDPPPRKPPRLPCLFCDDTGWITDNPEQRTVTPCPDCNTADKDATA